jgi:transcriptional regulator GlxA family with amidase domain
LTTSVEGVILKRHISFTGALDTLSDYDILVQPGGLSSGILPFLNPKNDTFAELLAVIQKFAKLGQSPRLGTNRIIMSVCTGALFLGYAGIFEGLEATTHFLALDDLRTVCQEYTVRAPGSKPATVVPEEPSQDFRYVLIQDAPIGTVRVISSGGISCGMDASLYLVGLLKGRDVAIAVANIMQYAWREMQV